MEKESLPNGLFVTDMMATLEKLGQFGVKARHLKSLRSDDGFAEKVAELLRSGGHQEYSQSQQEAREIMGARMVGLKDLSALGIEASRDTRDKMLRVPFSKELLEKYADSHFLIADPGLGDRILINTLQCLRPCRGCALFDQLWDPVKKKYLPVDIDFSALTDRGKMRWRLLDGNSTEGRRVCVTEISPDLETVVK